MLLFQLATHDEHQCLLPFVLSADQHRYMWYSAGSNDDVQIDQTGAWNEIPGLRLQLELPEPASIRVLYSMSVMPDQTFDNDGETWGKRNTLA